MELSACANNLNQALCPLFGPGNEMKLDFYTKLTHCLVVLSRLSTAYSAAMNILCAYRLPGATRSQQYNVTTKPPYTYVTLQYATPYVTITKPHCAQQQCLS